MKPIQKFEFPQELLPAVQKAKKLEWITVAYFISTTIVVFLTMGNSQAMKTAGFEDLLSLTPAVAYLVAARVCQKDPNKEFPYGYHRATSIGYLCSAVALFSVGCFLAIDSTMTLVKAEHATIGLVVIFGKPVWLGYLMIAAMLWSTIPSVILGRMKLPLAKKLHDKSLFTDAQMNKADWMTGIAAIFGVIGIGMGWWWADAAAGLLISLDILHDGFTNLKQSIFDLMDQIPKTVSKQETDPLLSQIDEQLRQQPWIKEYSFRFREEGHLYLGEAFVVPTTEENINRNIEQTASKVQKLSWRVHEFVIMPVMRLPQEEA